MVGISETTTNSSCNGIELNNNNTDFNSTAAAPLPPLLNRGDKNIDTNNQSEETTSSLDGATGVDIASNVSQAELALLAKLEQANKLIESDSKSLNSISNNCGHSRKSSDTSQISLTSATSSSHDRGDDCGSGGGSTGGAEEDSWTLWGRIVNDWENYVKKKNPFIKELVRKGVPHHFRSIVWQLLCGAYDLPVKKKYAEYIKKTSACEKVIRRDIARTYPEHDFFKEKDGLGQESLFNVMKAYSIHDLEVGYCQGSGFIVGLLLMQMPEEDAFAVFVKLMDDPNMRMRDMFKPTMAELGVCMYQLENLVQELLPDLFVHFQSQNFHTSMYASSWFLTLFTTTFSLPTACRVMDVFLSEGIGVIFQVALALLHLGRRDLLSLDMEGMLKFFQKELPSKADGDPDSLMVLAYSMKINLKKMKKLGEKYTAMKAEEQKEMVEIRKLKTDNRLLRQRVELLEAESSALADRLVRGQVSRAEEEETSYVVQRELAALRHTHLETLHELENTREQVNELSIALDNQNNNSSYRSQSSIEDNSLKESLSQKDEIISCLQSELVKVRLRNAENEVTIRDLRAQNHDLEEDTKKLRESTVDNSVAHLQEELIAVKLREAEANLSLKELNQELQEIKKWHQEKKRIEVPQNPESTPKKIGNLLNWNNGDYQRLEEELMRARIEKMEVKTELKELHLKVMELEAQVQVSGNQLKRQDEDKKELRELLDDAEQKERELFTKLKEQQYKYSDLESKMKDKLMMARIRDAEHDQMVAELHQKISRLELRNQEMVTEGELRSNVDDSDRVRDLQDKIVELKAEVLRLQDAKLMNGCRSSRDTFSNLVDTESDDHEDLPCDLQIRLQNVTGSKTNVSSTTVINS